jgi:hypothetical protein
MNARLKEVFEGKEGDFILTFVWQHGEEEGVLLDLGGST